MIGIDLRGCRMVRPLHGSFFFLHPWSAQGALKPAVITRVEGLCFWDEDGRRYADMSSQLVNSNPGHGNKAIIDAICEQAQNLPIMGPGFAMDCRFDAAEAVVELTGLKNAKVFFVNAGAEANENAIKFASSPHSSRASRIILFSNTCLLFVRAVV